MDDNIYTYVYISIYVYIYLPKLHENILKYYTLNQFKEIVIDFNHEMSGKAFRRSPYLDR